MGVGFAARVISNDLRGANLQGIDLWDVEFVQNEQWDHHMRGVVRAYGKAADITSRLALPLKGRRSLIAGAVTGVGQQRIGAGVWFNSEKQGFWAAQPFAFSG